MNWLIGLVTQLWSRSYRPTEHFWSSWYTIVGFLVILTAFVVIAYYANEYKTAIKLLENARGKKRSTIRKYKENKKSAYKNMVGKGSKWLISLSLIGILIICIQGHTIPVLILVGILACFLWFTVAIPLYLIYERISCLY